MANKVEVLLDRKANNLSFTTADDSTGTEVETTLSLEEAWILVTELNAAIRSLTTVEPKVIHTHHPAPKHVAAPSTPARVREAVLNSIGADQLRPRYVPPGFPATVTKKGLRNFHEEPVAR